MKQLIGSSNLFVMQVEMDVYTALKKVLMYEYKKLLHRKKKNITSHCFCGEKLEILLLGAQ
jgi:hypothetical protein